MSSTALLRTGQFLFLHPLSKQQRSPQAADYLRQLADADFYQLFQSAMHFPDRTYHQNPGLTQGLLQREARRRHITILRYKQRTLLPRYITAAASIMLFGLISLNGISGL